MIDIVLGSFYGDEGKGQTVHNLCKLRYNPLVVRFSGGHQVGHTVRHNTKEHTFSNYGSGTFLKVPTYWSEYCTVDPVTTLLELKDLNKLGLNPLIIYSPFCQVVTPYDVIAQWNNEENLKHGTVGTGFKSTLDRVQNGYSLMAVDCLNINVLRAKIQAIRDNYFFVSDGTAIESNIDNWCTQVYTYFKTVRLAHFKDVIMDYSDLIFEGSQGILLDQKFGIMPYCTPSNTTCQNALQMIQEISYTGAIEHWYVTRPYITRHGNGPLCTSTDIIPVDDVNNKFNDFQKSLRACKFDMNLFVHALLIDSKFFHANYSHKLNWMITHYDEMKPVGEDGVLDSAMWWFDGNVRISHYDEIISEDSEL